MKFIPYTDELEKINKFSKYVGNQYVLIRLTKVMIEKNNIDANYFLREMLNHCDLVDYDSLKNGGENGVKFDAIFLKSDSIENVKLKFYKVNNKRGDPRFSVEKIMDKFNKNELMVDDLLIIAIHGENNQIVISNITHNFPDETLMSEYFGKDDITKVWEELYPKFKEIIEHGYYNNSKGVGNIDPKDVGDTLEYLLGISVNNSPLADYKGIEIKAKLGKTKDTLFTLRPRFEGTEVEKIEPNDRFRVSAFTRLYGYYSEKHPDSNSLYITIGAKESPQNNQGFYLNVNEEKQTVEIYRDKKVVAFWLFVDLENELYAKHPATLWVKSESKMNGKMAQFKYKSVEMSRVPNFATFVSLIKEGIITYDWRGYTSKDGRYVGKNHGNAWRINPKYKKYLFGTIEKMM